MATTFEAEATIVARIQGKLSRTDELETARDQFDFNKFLSLGNADIEHILSRTYQVTDEDATNVPVSPATFSDAFGQTRELEMIRALMIFNQSTTVWVTRRLRSV